jgi:hypothetical protein
MRKLLSVIAVLAALLSVKSAHALGISAGILGGNGFKDGYNIGIGARVGITLPVTPIYIGGTFIYHFGKTETDPLTNADFTTKVLYLGPEVGYDIGVGPLPLTIRPYLGFGYSSITVNIPTITAFGVSVGGSDSASKLAFWPGATALVSFGGAFVGADARYVIITDSDSFNAFSLFATAGLSF